METNHSRHGEVAVADDDVVRRPHPDGALPAAPVARVVTVPLKMKRSS